jgi:hypothetical protein
LNSLFGEGEFQLADIMNDYSKQVPKDLIQHPPTWAQSMLERGTTLLELVQAVGDAARQCETRAQLKRVLRVVEQLALTDEGRQTINSVLSPEFISWLTAVVSPRRPAIYIPAIIVYDDANTAWPAAWLSPWEDETVWPVATLQQVQLDQAISAVWQDNSRPFVELFLFDGPDLQGRLARIARVHTPVVELTLNLDDPSLDNQSRSLLAIARSTTGRRFSATQILGDTVTFAFSQFVSQSGVSQFGTASLTEVPGFSWDGYATWLNSGGRFPPLPKTAALRLLLSLRIDDVLFGTTTVSAIVQFEQFIYKRNGGSNPIEMVDESGSDNLSQPWAGDFNTPRWGEFINGLGVSIGEAIAQRIDLLAGVSPGALRIFPGRSSIVPNPPQTHWGLIEIGRADDDATIVLFP